MPRTIVPLNRDGVGLGVIGNESADENAFSSSGRDLLG